MRKVIVSMMVSLDGFIEDRHKDLSAFKDDEEVLEYFDNLLDEVDIIMYGRRAYELMREYWPDSNDKSAEKMNAKKKIVFSRTLTSADWNTRVIHDHIAEEITALKKQPGKDLILYAGADIARTFRELNLVDEYHLAIYPVVLGGGTPLFKDVKDPLGMQLIDTQEFKSGVIVHRYKPIQ